MGASGSLAFGDGDEDDQDIDSDVEDLFLDAMDEIQEAGFKLNMGSNAPESLGQIDSSSGG